MKPREDEGFSLVETVVAMGIVGAVMVALAQFGVRSMTVVHEQGDAQTAIHLAATASERAHGLLPGSVLQGRGSAATAAQWAAAPAPVRAHTATLRMVWDTGAPPGAGAGAALPTAPQTVVRDGKTYLVRHYVGACWIAPTDPSGACTAAPAPATAPLYRVVVNVAWAPCRAAVCSATTSFLTASTEREPRF